jgi:hypothetical protein
MKSFVQSQQILIMQFDDKICFTEDKKLKQDF